MRFIPIYRLGHDAHIKCLLSNTIQWMLRKILVIER